MKSQADAACPDGGALGKVHPCCFQPSSDDPDTICDVPHDTGQGPCRLLVHNLLLGSDDNDFYWFSSMSVNARKTLKIDDPEDTLFRQARGLLQQDVAERGSARLYPPPHSRCLAKRYLVHCDGPTRHDLKDSTVFTFLYSAFGCILTSCFLVDPVFLAWHFAFLAPAF